MRSVSRLLRPAFSAQYGSISSRRAFTCLQSSQLTPTCRVMPISQSLQSLPSKARYNSSLTPGSAETTPIIGDIPADLLATPPPFTSEAVTTAVHAIGSLQALGLARWYTGPGLLQQLLEFVHVSTGLQWVAAIAVTTTIIRITVFPLMLKSIRNTSKLAIINPQIKENMAKLTAAQKTGDKAEVAQATLRVQTLFKENGVNPLMSIIPIFIQMPIFIMFYLALKGMVELPVPGMEMGGLLWATDLIHADPYHVLPLATSALTLINFEIGAEVGASQGTQMNPAMKNLFRLVMCAMPAFTWNFPVAIFGYWFTSSLFSLAQGFAFRNPSIRRRLSLPPMPPKVAPSAAADTKIEGGFFKAFNDTVKGVRDMKDSITEKAEAAARKQRAMEASKPKAATKFEEMDNSLQQRKIRQQDRIAETRKRRGRF